MTDSGFLTCPGIPNIYTYASTVLLKYVTCLVIANPMHLYHTCCIFTPKIKGKTMPLSAIWYTKLCHYLTTMPLSTCMTKHCGLVQSNLSHTKNQFLHKTVNACTVQEINLILLFRINFHMHKCTVSKVV